MVNAWVEHIRAFSKKNGISYMCAISNPEAKASYHKKKDNAKKISKANPSKEMEDMMKEDYNADPRIKMGSAKKVKLKKSKQIKKP